MESTSEVVQLKEQASSTLSSTVTKKCVQEVSATSIKEVSSSSLLQANEGSGIVIEDPNKLVGNQISSNVMELMYPDDPNTINTSSLQNEFVAMAIKDEHGNDIGQLTEQKQKEQSVKSSTSIATLDGGSTITSLTQLSSASSSSLAKQIATQSVVVEAQETSVSSSSVSHSSYSSSQKKEIVSSSTRSLSSVKSSQSSNESVVKSSASIVEEF